MFVPIAAREKAILKLPDTMSIESGDEGWREHQRALALGRFRLDELELPFDKLQRYDYPKRPHIKIDILG